MEVVETMLVRRTDDIVNVRQLVRKHALNLGFSLVDQTKIITAASELARNTVIHGNGGQMKLEIINNGERNGLRLIFEDHGPGIVNIDQALQDGFTTAGGLGMGLGGARRLSNEFEIQSKIGEGTRVTIVKWK